MRVVAVVLGAVLVTSVVAHGCSARKCSSNSECNSGQLCLYPIGDCSASGECRDVSVRPQQGCGTVSCSGNVLEYCGCNGSPVYSECGYPDGYASGPSSGQEPPACGNEAGLLGDASPADVVSESEADTDR